MKKLKIYLRPFLNWRFLVSFLIPWMITNGIWYVGLFLGTTFDIPWLRNTCLAYLAWLYMPWAAEKLIIIPVAIWICKTFIKDEKTIKQLEDMLNEAKKDLTYIRQHYKGTHNKLKRMFGLFMIATLIWVLVSFV